MALVGVELLAPAELAATGAAQVGRVDRDDLAGPLPFGELDDRGNMTADGPAFVSAGTTGTVTFDWSGLLGNTIYLGAISHNTPQGLVDLTLITIGN